VVEPELLDPPRLLQPDAARHATETHEEQPHPGQARDQALRLELRYEHLGGRLRLVEADAARYNDAVRDGDHDHGAASHAGAGEVPLQLAECGQQISPASATAAPLHVGEERRNRDAVSLGM